MYQLAWPWLLAAAPVPLLVAWLLPPARDGLGPALRIPFFERASALRGDGSGGRPARQWRAWLRLALLALAWLCLVLAAARPQHIGTPVGIAVNGRDLMLVIDTSASMATTDAVGLSGNRKSRLQAVQEAAGQFIRDRRGDRIGLILFGAQAYLQAPLTFDREAAGQLLDEALIGLAGETTAIGSAIALGIKRLHERPAASRVMVLLTDGANTAGSIDPALAAELAAVAGIRIHTIGFGGFAPGSQGRSTTALSSSLGLDEALLERIATATGGRYYRAADPQTLRDVYAELNALEPVAQGEEVLRPRKELYPWPLALALTLLFVPLVGPALAWSRQSIHVQTSHRPASTVSPTAGASRP